MTSATFPDTAAELFMCGLLLDIVRAEPGLHCMAYIDALVVAGRDGVGLLSTDDLREWQSLRTAYPIALGADIKFAEMWTLFQHLQAVSVHHGRAWPGHRFDCVRQLYPIIHSVSVGMIHAMFVTLRRTQDAARRARP